MDYPTLLDLTFEGTYIGKNRAGSLTYWRYLNKFYKLNSNGCIQECQDSEIEQLFTGVLQ